MNDFIYVREGDSVIPAAALQHRMVYRLAARGLHYGAWDESNSAFLGYKAPYLEYEYEWFGNGMSGTAHAVETIMPLPAELELRTSLTARCIRHERPTMTRPQAPGSRWVNWFHADDATPLIDGDHSYLPSYDALKDFFIALETNGAR